MTATMTTIFQRGSNKYKNTTLVYILQNNRQKSNRVMQLYLLMDKATKFGVAEGKNLFVFFLNEIVLDQGCPNFVPRGPHVVR